MSNVVQQSWTINVRRIGNGPIIYPQLDPAIGSNINGPSLIKVPAWVKQQLGAYYLYFADHKGDHIKLAYADDVLGPWKIHKDGALQLKDTPFLKEAPAIPTNVKIEALSKARAPGVPSKLDDMLIPHIASPDVVIDEPTKQIRLYYHGLDAFGIQPSRVAISTDGINFETPEEIVGHPYMRAFQYQGKYYGLTMPGIFYRSDNGITKFTRGPKCFNNDMRHNAVLVRADTLFVFWTQVGDKPERIYLSTIDLRSDWLEWKESVTIEILRPEFDYEGSEMPLTASSRSSVNHPVNELRDPAIFQNQAKTYLLYTVAGESGIAIAEIEIEEQKHAY